MWSSRTTSTFDLDQQSSPGVMAECIESQCVRDSAWPTIAILHIVASVELAEQMVPPMQRVDAMVSFAPDELIHHEFDDDREGWIVGRALRDLDTASDLVRLSASVEAQFSKALIELSDTDVSLNWTFKLVCCLERFQHTMVQILHGHCAV